MSFSLLCALTALFITCQATKFKVIIKTGNRYAAGTDANVAITVYGESGRCGPKYLDSPGDDFNSNARDEFTISCPTVKGNIEKIRIGQDNSGTMPGWYLDWVEITNLELKQSYKFPCYKWLATSEGDGAISRVLTPYSYKITVYTGTKSGSGTDATVRITMYGSNGECGPKKLDNSDNNFESGSVDEFSTSCPSLGELKKIHIAHDNAGSKSGWYLKKVVINDLIMGSVFTFPCDKWLATDEGDKHTWRDLTPA